MGGVYIPYASLKEVETLDLLCRIKGLKNHRELFTDLIQKEVKRIQDGENLPLMIAETLKENGFKWLKEKVGLKM